jgi:hypothetical protein
MALHTVCERQHGRYVNMSAMETLALRCDDPAEQLAKALNIGARTGRKANVRDFLFPKR